MFSLGVSSNNECGKNSTEILENIKKAGFDDVMIAAKMGTLESDLITAKKLGLNVPYVHLSTKNCDTLWCKGLEHEEAIKNIKEELKICAKYNVKIVVMHATHGRAEIVPYPPTKHALNSVLDILETAKSYGIKIALENCDLPNFKHFKFLMKNIKDENFGFCYDVGHHNLYMPKIDLLKKYGSRLLAIHLHDNLMDWTYGFDWTRDLHRLPFDGKIDFEKACKQLAKLNYTGSIMLELHKTYYNKYPNIYDNLNNLDFLKEARKRGSLLAEKIEKFKAE